MRVVNLKDLSETFLDYKTDVERTGVTIVPELFQFIYDLLDRGGVTALKWATTVEARTVLDDFVQWLVKEPIAVRWGDVWLNSELVDVGLRFNRPEDLTDDDWSECYEWLYTNLPLQWTGSSFNDEAIVVPRRAALAETNVGAMELLKVAGYDRVYNTLAELDDPELTTEDVIAGQLAGLLVTGTPISEITDTFVDGVRHGTIPFWTEPDIKADDSEIGEIYERVLTRLLDA